MCNNLDSDYLMQPVNEAEYDSETQACIDLSSGKEGSYYSHFVTKLNLKKGVEVGLEIPIREMHNEDSNDYLMPPGNGNFCTTLVSEDIFNDPVARRLATGSLPPQA